ncbi:hypothetical protein K435DRAFT_641062 [Dendrothele bispora CBS 962.96]|uniref:DH domain-containing protein n=1 Tax=Dendrothele bispora (strain CBS 962.96) TaxID=1314807 RepID=A0A4S8N0J3_DENBC|nr:hypothetical protein K435DRAFT_641062 [Dendrothele bispora CBS 962.96]
MSFSTSPRKTVPLASGDETKHRNLFSKPSTTKRVFFCGVVVEGSEGGKRLPEDIQELVLSLGDVVGSESENILTAAPNRASESVSLSTTRKRALTDTSALTSAVNELVATEQSYVKRLRTLKHDYADPLRNFARSKSTAILPKYEAKTLFGNIDNLLPVNEAFLTDLEKMCAPNGARTVGGIGDVALKHFKDLSGFEQYKQYYVKREEAQRIFERELAKRSSPFAAYIDRIKYQSADMRNRIGLRELLMDPVQRIPRYTLLFRLMIKHMAQDDPQRAKLIEADEIASKIALAEADEQTQRAAIFHCLVASIEGFPPELISNSRCFIDCIDVEDVLTEPPLSSSASVSSSLAGSLHCTLFLFDDKLLLVKRPSNTDKGGRSLAGLDDVDKITKSGGIPNGRKRSGMVCKGMFDVTDVVATDVGGSDFHLYLENPPYDQTERWSGRPFRSYNVVHPPSLTLDPTQTETDKQRFLENLWNIQAKYRAKLGQSVVLQAEDLEVESRNGKLTFARTYYNVYQRTAFLQDMLQTKIVVHIDAQGTADEIPFGLGSPPFAVIRVQPLAGGVCRFKVTSNDPSDPGEDDVVQTARVPSRIVFTIHNFGLFEFRTGRNSRPTTPTVRSKVSIFGLDAISRNLFNARPGSAMDFFSGSVNGRKRTKSTASRSSTRTRTTSTADSSVTKYSLRSQSTTTAATSVEDESSIYETPPGTVKKLQKHRGRSPGGAVSETEASLRRSVTRSSTRSSRASRSMSRDRDSDFTDMDEDDDDFFRNGDFDKSDQDLALQLELARRNSKNQNDRQVRQRPEPPTDVPIYEDNPFLRPASRASTARDSTSQCTITPGDVRSPSPRPRSLSRNPSDRRPLGPRSPSPLPPSRSPRPPSTIDLPPMDTTDDLVAEISNIVQPSTESSARPTGIPRSKRQPLHPTGNQATSRAGPSSVTNPVVEPLSIKKKTSIRSSYDVASPTPVRKSGRNSLSRTPGHKVITSRRVSPQIRSTRSTASPVPSPQISSDLDKVVQLAWATKEDIESSHRSVKRIKLEISKQRSSSNAELESNISRPSSPVKGLRTPQRDGLPTSKAAQERLEEMRALIGQRTGDLTPRTRPQSVFGTPLRAHSSVDSPTVFNGPSLTSLEPLASEVEMGLVKAVSNQETLLSSLQQLSNSFKERVNDLERTKIELSNSKRQCEVVKSLLTDATNEKEIMYEAFNEELDSMYNDANLPEDEAWTAMTQDLKTTKEARNTLAQENSELKRRLAEVELQKEEWGALLRHHGLIP